MATIINREARDMRTEHPGGPAHPATAGLAPYAGPWTRAEAAHLARRTMFGATKRDIDALSAMSAQSAVNALLSGAGGSFRLTDVFRVTPRPAAIGGNGNSRLLFPLLGSAVTT
ncbi:MAG: hypothetical protein ACKOBV_07525, partial [Candidatus Kapaibacterium sp.]